MPAPQRSDTTLSDDGKGHEENKTGGREGELGRPPKEDEDRSHCQGGTRAKIEPTAGCRHREGGDGVSGEEQVLMTWTRLRARMADCRE